MTAAVKERPLPYQPDMVRAVLHEVYPKWQTRRILTWKPLEPGLNLAFSGLSVGHYCTGVPSSGWVLYSMGGSCWQQRTYPLHCPYGAPGDRLYVKEAWRTIKSLDKLSPAQIGEKAIDAGYRKPWTPIEYLADGERRNFDAMREWSDKDPTLGRYRHGRFMPRWASRITLEITDIRVQRLQDITPEDAKAEGAPYYVGGHGPVSESELRIEPGYWHGIEGYRQGFEHLWGEINGWEHEPKVRCPWQTNPWVWAISFRRITP